MYDETKKQSNIATVEDTVKDFQELDKLASQLVELSKLVKNNRHEYCKSIGASLKGHISKNDIIFIATALDPIIDSTNVKNTIIWLMILQNQQRVQDI